MKIHQEKLILSASDLSNHMACKHRTTLDMAVANGELKMPAFRDPSILALQERGRELEHEYLELYRGQGADINEPVDANDTGIERTLKAMKQGVDIIYQASLEGNGWTGRADFLKKVEVPSRLGKWSYEIVDAKLARETRGSTILQLALYSEMLANMQGKIPEQMHVITPGVDKNHFSYRLADFFAYYRFIKKKLKKPLKIIKRPPILILYRLASARYAPGGNVANNNAAKTIISVLWRAWAVITSPNWVKIKSRR